MAAGTSRSQSRVRISWLLIGCAPGNPLQRLLARPVLEHALDRRGPAGCRCRRSPPLTATTVQPASSSSFALMLPTLPNPCTTTRRLVRAASQVLEGRHRADGHAATGGLDPAQRAADLDRLAGHRRWDRVAEVHRKRVHDPRHRLRVGAHVGRGDVAVGADEDRDLGREAAGHVLELVERELARVAR